MLSRNNSTDVICDNPFQFIIQEVAAPYKNHHGFVEYYQLPQGQCEHSHRFQCVHHKSQWSGCRGGGSSTGAVPSVTCLSYYGNPMKGSYKRNHEGDYHAAAEDVKAMLRDANDAGNDGTLLKGYGMEDIDLETLRAYRMEYELRNPDHVFNTLDNKQFLTQLGGYTRDRLTGKEGLTTAGLMMFGKGLPIREHFDNISMDYLDQTNLIGDSRWSDRLTYDGMWENNLYNFMRRVIPKLISDLKRPFRIEGMSRIDDTPLHMAIREIWLTGGDCCVLCFYSMSYSRNYSRNYRINFHNKD